VGKDTLIEQWQLVAPNVRRLVTYTTRPQALTERHGLDYYFVTEEEFEVLREQGAFIEYAQVHGNWYGTPRREMEELREAGAMWCCASMCKARCRCASSSPKRF
jgi:guanylate kinase